MNKLKTLLALLLSFCVLLTPLTVYADTPADAAETEETEEAAEEAPPEPRYAVIASEEDFIRFAEQCRIDTFSRGLTVTMMTDLDLSGMEISSIPIFAGVFDGGGHTVRGISLAEDGSVRGLFRYVDSGAEIRNLHLSGTVAPNGSRSTVGGIAGSNAGTIRDCSFEGEISGADEVGGIAGTNAVGGVIEGCNVRGMVHGSHFVGGIAGSNNGVIRDCGNEAEINTTEEDNKVELSDITIETMTGAESASTATDIGGIAGTSSGVIRDCTNLGNVGYIHVGYNIGGIAGSQLGYLYGCTNRGTVLGRKEVGGIVGQMEPNALLQFETDTLQTLQEQMEELDGIAGQAQANLQSSSSQLTAQIGAMESEIEKAGQALEELLPADPEDPIPDEDTLLAAQNVLSSTMTTLTSQLNSMVSSTQGAVSAMTGSLQALTGQMNTIGETMGNAASGLGGSITDVSDLDTAELLTGKVQNCVNHGAVQGDINAGGIAGAISVESDLDPEEDLQIAGDSSLKYEFEARAVVLGCENQGVISGRNRNIGGIVGWMSMGLVRDCLNAGAIRADGGEYVGGIAGRSSGYIRASDANCALYGERYVGGIAGAGTVVTDCRTMVQFHGGRERLGAILGLAEEPQAAEIDEPVLHNYYFAADADLGAIDGVSYGGKAEPLAEKEFLALENLPEIFRIVRIRFVFEDGSEQTLIRTPGKELKEDSMPPIPEKSGYAAAWVGPEWLNPACVSFDVTFHAVYTELRSVLQSAETAEDGKPLLLVQGVFMEGEAVQLLEAADLPALGENETVLLRQGFTLPRSSEPMSVRLLLPETEGEIRVMVRNASGGWRTEPALRDHSYLVFSVAEGDTACCVIRVPRDRTLWYLAGGGVLLAALLITGIALAVRKRKKKAA
ncbi:MAG: hypothetical protein IJP11_02390 [Oscillospiraceae bacterium]|nr:hypothetical protein [Oscillospiraceae bacterium]